MDRIKIKALQESKELKKLVTVMSSVDINFIEKIASEDVEDSIKAITEYMMAPMEISPNSSGFYPLFLLQERASNLGLLETLVELSPIASEYIKELESSYEIPEYKAEKILKLEEKYFKKEDENDN